MQDHPRLRQHPVQRAMHGPSRWVGGIRPVHDIRIIGIEQQQVARLDRSKMLPARIEQEFPPIRRDRCAEMIADRLAPAEAMAQPEGSGEVLPQRGQRCLIEHVVDRRGNIHALNRPSVVSAR